MRRLLSLALAAAVTATTATVATADIEPPILHAVQKRGTAIISPLRAVAPTAKVVDGKTRDWTGAAPGFSGLASYSRGELIYDDYLFDAFGAEDGDDAERVARNDALEQAYPGFYRLEPTYQYDPAGEIGAPSGELGLEGERQYGDARDTDGRGMVAAADLREVRVAADRKTVNLLIQTTTMTSERSAGVVVLADTVGGSKARDIPFGSGLRSSTADLAFFLSRKGGIAVDLATGKRSTFRVAADDEANVLEAGIPRSLLKGTGLRLAIASGVSNNKGGLVDLKSEKADLVNVANVAFRPNEPVRIRFDKRQAFALADRTIDEFFTNVDLPGLLRGRTEALRPGPATTSGSSAAPT